MKDKKRKTRLARAFAGFILGAIVGWIISAVALAMFDADVLINNPSSPIGQMRSFAIVAILVFSFIGADFGAVVGIIIALESSSRAHNRK
jgi:hypothetical protein